MGIFRVYSYLLTFTVYYKKLLQGFSDQAPCFSAAPTWRRGRGRGERRRDRLRGRGDTAIHPSFHRPPLFPPPPGGDRYMVHCRNPGSATPPRARRDPLSHSARQPVIAPYFPINDTESPQTIGIAGFVVNMQLNFPFLRRRRPLVGLQ